MLLNMLAVLRLFALANLRQGQGSFDSYFPQQPLVVKLAKENASFQTSGAEKEL